MLERVTLSGRVRPVHRLLAPIVIAATVFGTAPVGSGLTDQEKREMFLRAREEMRAVPKATATPRPKPKPAASPKATPRSTPKSSPTPAVTPPVTPVQTPAQPTPEATPTPKPRPTPTAKTAPTARVAPAPTPKASPPPSAPLPPAQVKIEKSGLEKDEGLVEPPKQRRGWFGGGGPKYKYLTKAVRDQIDRAPVKRKRWKFIVIHNSATRQGNAKIFEYYHKNVRKMPNGLAYHFVIGNGRSSGDGEIEIGNRWHRQINGGHVHSDYLNNIAIGICLVGDYNRDLPTQAQLGALDELIRYLRMRVGKIDGKPSIVKPHRQMNPPRWPTDCPGDRFPYRWLQRYE